MRLFNIQEEKIWENVEIEGRQTEIRATHALVKTAHNNLLIIQGYGELYLDNVMTFDIKKNETTGKFTYLAPNSKYPIGRSHIISDSIIDGEKTIVYLFGGFDGNQLFTLNHRCSLKKYGI